MPHINKNWIEKQFQSFSEKISSTFSKNSDLKNYLTKTGNISDTTATFEESKELENISSDDKTSTIFGKLKKWFSVFPSTNLYGRISNLSDFNQINNSYRFWGISTIDSSYAAELGIERNTGDFNALVLSYNGDGTNFNFGNIILSSPRLNNDYYLVQMWEKVPHVTYHRANVPSLTNNLLATTPGTALDAAQGKILSDRIDQLNSDLPKIKNFSIFLKDVEFTRSAGGMYYANVDVDLPSGSTVLSCTFLDWSYIRETDLFQLYIPLTECAVGIMSNTNDLSSNTHLIIRVVYI